MGKTYFAEKKTADEIIRRYYKGTPSKELWNISNEKLLENHIATRIAAIVRAEKNAYDLMAPVYGRDRYFFKTCPMPGGGPHRVTV